MEISHFFDIDAGRLSIVVARLTIYQQIIHSLIVKKKEKKKKKRMLTIKTIIKGLMRTETLNYELHTICM